MFYDLNVDIKSFCNRYDDILNQLRIFRYRGLALTTDMDDTPYITELPKSRRKHKQEEKDHVPPPMDITAIKAKYPEFEMYMRINILVTNTESIRKILQSKNMKQYDLFSIQPFNGNILKALASVPEIDIISYNPDSKFPFTFSRKLYNQFVHQNTFFELIYSPGIASAVTRKNLISISHIYHSVGRSRNIIVSSGTMSPNHIRGPYDVMNFNLLFGLNEDQAKSAISKNCKTVLIRARKRKRGKAMFEIEHVDSNEKEANCYGELMEE